jgi:hypothetical protein
MKRKEDELDRKGMVHCAFVPVSVPEGTSNGLEYLSAHQRHEEEEMLGKGKGGRLTLVGIYPPQKLN